MGMSALCSGPVSLFVDMSYLSICRTHTHTHTGFSYQLPKWPPHSQWNACTISVIFLFTGTLALYSVSLFIEIFVHVFCSHIQWRLWLDDQRRSAGHLNSTHIRSSYAHWSNDEFYSMHTKRIVNTEHVPTTIFIIEEYFFFLMWISPSHGADKKSISLSRLQRSQVNMVIIYLSHVQRISFHEQDETDEPNWRHTFHTYENIEFHAARPRTQSMSMSHSTNELLQKKKKHVLYLFCFFFFFFSSLSFVQWPTATSGGCLFSIQCTLLQYSKCSVMFS